MSVSHFELVMLFERLYRLFMEIIKRELENSKTRDMNSVQSLLLYNIGKEKLTVGDIQARKYYTGSNVSYNLKKMSENKYIEQSTLSHDKRSTQIALSSKGMNVYERMGQILERQEDILKTNKISQKEIATLFKGARDLEKIWIQVLSSQDF